MSTTDTTGPCISSQEILDELRKIGHTFKKPSVLPMKYKPSRFEKLMNRLGWYKQTEVIVVRESQLFGSLLVNGWKYPTRQIVQWKGYDA